MPTDKALLDEDDFLRRRGSTPVTFRMLHDVVSRVGRALKARDDERLAALEKRIAELEGQASYLKEFGYRGVWLPSVYYRRGNLCTYQGGIWHCEHDTNGRPGTSGDWKLCVKSPR